MTECNIQSLILLLFLSEFKTVWEREDCCDCLRKRSPAGPGSSHAGMCALPHTQAQLTCSGHGTCREGQLMGGLLPCLVPSRPATEVE